MFPAKCPCTGMQVRLEGWLLFLPSRFSALPDVEDPEAGGPPAWPCRCLQEVFRPAGQDLDASAENARH